MRSIIGWIFLILGLALFAFGVYMLWFGEILGFVFIVAGAFSIFVAYVTWTGRKIAELVDSIVTFFIMWD